jgi:hypothetical protein
MMRIYISRLRSNYEINFKKCVPSTQRKDTPILKSTGRKYPISNTSINLLPYDDYLTVMSHRYANDDPEGEFTTIDDAHLSTIARLALNKDTK